MIEFFLISSLILRSINNEFTLNGVSRYFAPIYKSYLEILQKYFNDVWPLKMNIFFLSIPKLLGNIFIITGFLGLRII